VKKDTKSTYKEDPKAIHQDVEKENQDDILEEEQEKTFQSTGDDQEKEIPKGEEESSEETENNNKVENLEKKCQEYLSKMQRVAADFENYKKRVSKERESTYVDALAEAVLAFLPVIDNFERALNIPPKGEDESFRKGIEMLFKQFGESFKKLGVKEIETLGKKFDPEFHNAVMHVEDETYGEGEIIEEFQKGYVLGEKVIRHSMVKVAN
jgi:molecular chaperone GrpE